MSGSARVDSVDTMQAFRLSLVKFAEAANTALADAEAEAQRTLVWLETEQDTYWQGQIRKRHEDVERCKDAVRQKKLYKSSTGHTQSAVEEEKALRVAQRRLEEAQQKLKNVRRWIPRMQKEIANFKGGIQRLTTSVLADIPVAVSRLDKMITALRQYAALSITGSGVMEGMDDVARTMARAAAELSAQPDYSPLRKKTAAIDRTKATPGSLQLETWSDGLASEREREVVGKIQAQRLHVSPEETLLVEQGVWQSQRIYLERVTPVESDCGWALARADEGHVAPPGEGEQAAPMVWLRVTVNELLSARPDLAELLALPPGYLAIIDSGGITVILNEKGDDQYNPLV